MAETIKILGQSAPLAGILTDAYVAPALTSAVVSSLVVCNTTAAAINFRVSVAQAGAVNTIKQYLYYDIPCPANDTFTATIGISLATTDVIRVYSATLGLSFNIFGVEVV